MDTKELFAQSDACKDQKYINNVMEKIRLQENKISKDILAFSSDEILDYYKSLGYSFGTLSRINNNMKQYVDWCISQNVFIGDNLFEKITKNELEDCSKKDINKYFTHEQIVELSAKLINPEDSFIFYGVYMGLFDNQVSILNTKISDIDIKNSKIKNIDGKEIDVDLVLIKYAIASFNAKEHFLSNLRSEPIVKTGDYIVQHLDKEESRKDPETVYKRILRCRKFLGKPDLTIPKLVASGFINESIRISKLMGVDLYKFYKTEECDLLKERYQIITNTKPKINAMYKRYLS